MTQHPHRTLALMIQAVDGPLCHQQTNRPNDPINNMIRTKQTTQLYTTRYQSTNSPRSVFNLKMGFHCLQKPAVQIILDNLRNNPKINFIYQD